MPANDPRYQGIYNDRELALDELKEMNAIVRESPWTADRLEKVFEKLYDGCREHAEEYAALSEELELLQRKLVEKPSAKVKKQLDDLKADRESKWDWFKSFDRRVYLLHVQLAATETAVKSELVDRYALHAELQQYARGARNAFNKASDYDNFFKSLSPKEITDDLEDEYLGVLESGWKTLKRIARDARELNLPALKHFPDAKALEEYLLDGALVPEPPKKLKESWVSKLMGQLQGVRNRSARLAFKSLNGILDLQEKLIAKWRSGQAAAPAVEDAMEAEVMEAEVMEAEVMEAEVMEAEVMEAEVMEAEAEVMPLDDAVEVLPLDPSAAELVPAEVVPSAPPVAPTPATPTPVATSPATPPAAAVEELPESTVGQIFALDAVASAMPSNELFSLDLDRPAAPAASAPVEFAPAQLDATTAALAPAVSPPASVPAEEIFSLDTDEASAPPAAEAAFSLDADDLAPTKPATPLAPTTAAPVVPMAAAPVVPMKPAAPSPAVQPASPAAPVVPIKPAAPRPAVQPAAAAVSPAKPATTAAPATALSVMSLPALDGANGSSSRKKWKRPPVKITFVRPGQKSPFAK